MSSQPPWFPCHAISFNSPIDDSEKLVTKFIEHRPDSNWLLLVFDAAASERHLWSAWLAMRRGFAQGTAISRNPDGEFLRLISGTHQIRIGFERAGIRSGDESAWIVRLPDDNESGTLPETEWKSFTADALPLINKIDADLITARPEPRLSGLERLCIESDVDSNILLGESLFINHIIQAQTSA